MNDINKALSTNYKLSKIYFSPFDNDSSSVYSLLVCKLIHHYHDGKVWERFLKIDCELKWLKPLYIKENLGWCYYLILLI